MQSSLSKSLSLSLPTISPGARPARWSRFTFQSPLLSLGESAEYIHAYTVCIFDRMSAAQLMGFSILNHFWQLSAALIASLWPAATTSEQIKLWIFHFARFISLLASY